MGTFLIGWELGGERGHVALIEPVVQALRERGHVVHVVVKEPGAIPADSELRRGRMLTAPAWPTPDARTAGAPASQTVGDDFAAAGLADATEVLAHARWWRDLIGSLGADVVLAESAPTLLLGGRGRCPVIAFGTAYRLPPPGMPLPVVLDVHRHQVETSRQAEQALCAAFDSADRALGGPGLVHFSDLFAVPAWVCNLAELDPYGPLRARPAPGPLLVRHASEALLRGRIPPLLGSQVFVYVKPSAVFPALMEALAPRCQRIELFVPGAPTEMHNPWPHVTVRREPVDLQAQLHEFSAVVHFGGLNLSAEALLTGVPQLVFPQHLEQSATAAAVQRLGVGHGCLGVPREPDRQAQRQAMVSSAVAAFFGDTGLAARAARFAAQLRSRQQPSLPGLVTLCEAMLRAAS
jgi:hypothetical protein